MHPARVGAGCGSQSAVDVPIATVMVRSGSSDVQFRGVEIAWVSGWAATVESGTTGVTFEGCHVHDVGSGAIRHTGLSASRHARNLHLSAVYRWNPHRIHRSAGSSRRAGDRLHDRARRKRSPGWPWHPISGAVTLRSHEYILCSP